MKTEEVKIEDALSKDYWQQEGYQHIWLQEYSRVELLPVKAAKDLNAGDLLEARIFTDQKEIHIFPAEEGLKAVVTVTEDGDDYFEETQLLRERFGKSLTLRNFVGYDDDGQAYIARTAAAKYHEGGIGHE